MMVMDRQCWNMQILQGEVSILSKNEVHFGNISVTSKVYKFEAFCLETFTCFAHVSQHLQNE